MSIRSLFCAIFVHKKKMEQLYPEIEQLKDNIEKKLGRTLKSPVDFDLLSYKLNESIHEQISASTLKRLWGYVQTSHTPRFSTLSTLARYIGFLDWDSYCISFQQINHPESLFFSGKCILSTELNEGDVLEIGWNPNRHCMIRYTGNSVFIVLQSQNAKLKVGDSFRAEQFHLNQPLIITNLKQEGRLQQTENVNYVAGYETGLTQLSFVKEVVD